MKIRIIEVLLYYLIFTQSHCTMDKYFSLKMRCTIPKNVAIAVMLPLHKWLLLIPMPHSLMGHGGQLYLVDHHRLLTTVWWVRL